MSAVRLFIYCLMVVSVPQALAVLAPQTSVPIRVRIAEDVARGDIRGFDLKVYQGDGTLVMTPDRQSIWSFSCRAGKVAFGDRELTAPVSVVTPTGFLHFGTRLYREKLTIHSVGNDRTGRSCEVVNELDLEKYLDGVVNSEFSAKWDEDAMGAQVIAARTYAYFQIQQARHRHPPARFDVDASVKDQVYDGSHREDFRASRMIEKTRGMVLAVHSSQGEWKPLKAFYHSMCGGKTELPENVWGKHFSGLNRKVECPYCRLSPAFNWSLTLSSDDLASALRRGAHQKGVPSDWPSNWREIIAHWRLERIDMETLASDARVKKVSLFWQGEASAVSLSLGAAQFRDWIGPAKLRSTVFSVLPMDPLKPGVGWKFTGTGNGHGVGMCQWGAKIMGEKGFTTAKILKFYYPNAVLKKVW